MPLDIFKFVLMNEDLCAGEALHVGNVVEVKVAEDDRSQGVRGNPTLPEALQQQLSITTSAGIEEDRSVLSEDQNNGAPA